MYHYLDVGKVDQECCLPFLKPCKAINAKDVDFMYVELIQRCKQLFLVETDTAEDHAYQMPAFLQSLASVLLYLDTVRERVTEKEYIFYYFISVLQVIWWNSRSFMHSVQAPL